LLFKVKVIVAARMAGPVLVAPVLLRALMVHVALVADTLGVNTKLPAASKAARVPPLLQTTPVRFVSPGVAPARNELAT
jgi:hypothetical protein